MRVVQFRILKEILEKYKVPDYIHAFEAGKSIPEMVKNHIGKDLVISVDLKDFFPSVKQYHVQRLFEEFGFDGVPARLLSEICTYSSFLPQGALTSPKISNCISAMTFGPELKEYCDKNNATLTIFADDITISVSEYDSSFIANTLNFIRGLTRKFGFNINEQKTKVMTRRVRQYVCGVVVNEKSNLLKKERERLRSIVYNCRMNGFEAEANKSGTTADNFYAKILGKLNWYSQLNMTRAQPLIEELKMYQEIYKTQRSLAVSSKEEAPRTEVVSAPVASPRPEQMPW